MLKIWITWNHLRIKYWLRLQKCFDPIVPYWRLERCPYPLVEGWQLRFDSPPIHSHVKDLKIEMLFCFQNFCDLLWEKNWTSDREKLLKFEAKGREFVNFWDHLNNLLEQWKVRPIFETECFLTCSWRLLRSNILEQLEFKLEKIIGT